MAAVDPPAGLMDITSTLPQDEIPMKLRCAICNMLAVNAFRLPCCDQSICETCQSSLVDTCPVCAHTPVSPDLCKPNKALRTTLKAYLRTEEKKREKERQAAAASTPAISTPAESENVPTDIAVDQPTTEPTPADTPEIPAAKESAPDEPTQETEDVVTTETVVGNTTVELQTLSDEHAELAGDQITDPSNPGANAPPTDGDIAISDELAQETQEAAPSAMNMGGGFPGMGWNGNGNFNGMNPFMANPMFFSNPMGMPMGMDPMANQGMFGDYGMNMTGMGMNGMNFEGQGMYGSLGWDSQQNMWQGGQDKFNPNAFPNGSGPPYGGAFGGPNMSYPNDFQSGYNGPGYGRGGFRGRGRGHFYGPGRGGYGPGQGHYSHTNHGLPNRPGSSASAGPSVAIDTEVPQDLENSGAADAVAMNDNEAVSADPTSADDQQLQGIPTIDSLDQALPSGPGGYQGAMGPGYGRGGYMRGSMPHSRGGYWGGHMSQSHIEPRNPGVEGAPAAPRAMRQGLPNTSVLRQRGGFHQARPSVGSTAAPTKSDPDTPTVIRELSQAPSQPRRASRSPSPPQKQASRAPSPSAPATDDGREGRRERDARRLTDRRTRSPSGVSSRRSSRPRHRDSDRERRSGHRSHRSRRHRTRSRSCSLSRSTNRNGDSRQPDRFTAITQDEQNSHSKSSGKINPRDLATRIGNSHRTSRDRPSRREEDRERDRPRDSRRGEHNKDRGRDRRDRDRGDRADQADRTDRADRDRERDRRREKERDRERDRNRGRDREKDRKRSRRDRSESVNASDSHPRSRRVKRETDDRKDREAESVPEPEKDPHTLEREARNRERLQREQQRREQAKSGNRRDSRQERAVAGRRTNYQYEDEL